MSGVARRGARWHWLDCGPRSGVRFFEITIFAGFIRGLMAHEPGYAAMQKVPGIGPTPGPVMAAEIDDLSRFASASNGNCAYVSARKTVSSSGPWRHVKARSWSGSRQTCSEGG